MEYFLDYAKPIEGENPWNWPVVRERMDLGEAIAKARAMSLGSPFNEDGGNVYVVTVDDEGHDVGQRIFSNGVMIDSEGTLGP